MIPREGVERINAHAIIVAFTVPDVIPREGVESSLSLVRLCCDDFDRVVIPREGVDSELLRRLPVRSVLVP